MSLLPGSLVSTEWLEEHMLEPSVRVVDIRGYVKTVDAGTGDGKQISAYVGALDEYDASHIPGAVSVSAWETPQDKVNELLEKGAVLEAPVVVYCGAAKDCEDSKIVSGLLKGAGFVNIIIYKGGFPEWQAKAGKLVAKGTEPGTLDPELLPKEEAP